MKRRFLLEILIIGVFLAGCIPTNTPTIEPPPTAPPVVQNTESFSWWKTAVFYEIFVRSFYDSNGDGVGDFNGIIEKLDYLNDGNPETHNDLGITAIWLMPINPSQTYHGYDVLNYYNVNPEYGSLQDFKKLLEECHKRGIRVIIDLVLNHTSSSHPFFINASYDENAQYHNWYIWSAENLGAHWHFSGTGPNSQYFYGYFSPTMPDLNYRNPEVTAQMEKVTAFWLQDIGVDGFRIDAAKHLIEDGKVLENTQATHDWFKGFYTFYKGLNKDAYVVGEVAGSDARISETYDDDQMDMIFNFEVASGFVNSANGGSISGVGSAITFIQKDDPDWNFATLLTNHDQNRVMSTLGGNVDKAKVAAALLLTSPGTPFIYYGEEIGMQGVKPDENIRRPMQWSGNQNAGFSSKAPWEAVGENYPDFNVLDEENAPDSLLNWYKQLINLRSEKAIFSVGDYVAVKCTNRGIYAALREYEGEASLVVINLTKNPISDVSLTWEGSALLNGKYQLSSLLDNSTGWELTSLDGKVNQYKPIDVIGAFQTLVFQLKKIE